MAALAPLAVGAKSADHVGTCRVQAPTPCACRLIFATLDGKLDEVHHALAQLGSASLQTAGCVSALQAATMCGHVAIMKVLIAAGADLEFVDKNGLTPLHAAAASGHLRTVKALLSEGASVDSIDKHGRTALMTAAAHGHTHVIHALLTPRWSGSVRHGGVVAAVNRADHEGGTALHLAAQQNQLEATKVLLAAGAGVDLVTEAGFTPLSVAACRGNATIIKALIAAGANLADRGEATREGRGALQSAAHFGHLEAVVALIGSGAPLDRMDQNGLTPLIVATHHGFLEIVHALLAAGAAVDLQLESGDTALYHAASPKLFKANTCQAAQVLVKLLMANGASVALTLQSHPADDRLQGALIALAAEVAAEAAAVARLKGDVRSPGHALGVTQQAPSLAALAATGLAAHAAACTAKCGCCLVLAAQEGDLGKVQRALVKLGSANLPVPGGVSALQIAASNGHAAVMRALIAAGAELDCADEEHGSTALHLAASNGHLDAVRALLSAGASANLANKWQGTALMAAAANGHPHIIKALLTPWWSWWSRRRGPIAAIDQADTDGETALYGAAQIGQVEAVKALLAAGASVDLANKAGQTPLCIAAAGEDPAVVRALLAAGADWKVTDKAGFSPLEIAVCHDRVRIVKLLLASGASMRHGAEARRGVAAQAQRRGAAQETPQAGFQDRQNATHGSMASQRAYADTPTFTSLTGWLWPHTLPIVAVLSAACLASAFAWWLSLGAVALILLLAAFVFVLPTLKLITAHWPMGQPSRQLFSRWASSLMTFWPKLAWPTSPSVYLILAHTWTSGVAVQVTVSLRRGATRFAVNVGGATLAAILSLKKTLHAVALAFIVAVPLWVSQLVHTCSVARAATLKAFTKQGAAAAPPHASTSDSSTSHRQRRNSQPTKAKAAPANAARSKAGAGGLRSGGSPPSAEPRKTRAANAARAATPASENTSPTAATPQEALASARPSASVPPALLSTTTALQARQGQPDRDSPADRSAPAVTRPATAAPRRRESSRHAVPAAPERTSLGSTGTEGGSGPVLPSSSASSHLHSSPAEAADAGAAEDLDELIALLCVPPPAPVTPTPSTQAALAAAPPAAPLAPASPRATLSARPLQHSPASAAAGSGRHPAPAASTASSTEEPPRYLCCSITSDLFVDPVVASDGHTYSRTAIQQWLLKSRISPMTGLQLAHTALTPNVLVRDLAITWSERHRS